MLLYLIRHGESTDNAGTTPPLQESASDLERQWALDSHLTELGRQQVEGTGAWLAGKGITHLYSSLMVRALQTGEILSRHLGVPVHALAPLCECRSGPGFKGLPRQELETLFPACRLPQECREEGWWDQSVEDEAASYLRAEAASHELLALHAPTEDRVAVVTHGLFGSALLSVLLGAPPCGYKRFLMENAAVSLLEITTETIRLAFHNYTFPMKDLNLTYKALE
jgi:broad specificity phosphatase PhoE